MACTPRTATIFARRTVTYRLHSPTDKYLDGIKFSPAFDNKLVCSTKSSQYSYPNADSILACIQIQKSKSKRDCTLASMSLVVCAEHALNNGFVYFSFHEEFHPDALTKCVGFHSRDCAHRFEQPSSGPIWTTYAVIGKVAPTPSPTKPTYFSPRCFRLYHFWTTGDYCWTNHLGPGYGPNGMGPNGWKYVGTVGLMTGYDKKKCLDHSGRGNICNQVSYYGNEIVQ
jgi:hypothetical protein